MSEENVKKLKLMFHAIEATGHSNAAIGFAQILAARGHEIVFVMNETMYDHFAKYGFRVLSLKQNSGNNVGENKFELDENPAKQFAKSLEESGLFSNKNSIEKMLCFQSESYKKISEGLEKLMIEYNVQLEDYLQQEKPDAFIQDHSILLPAIYRAQIPWILVCSGAPLWYYNSPILPPPGSGYPIDDDTKWKDFYAARMVLIADNLRSQRLLNDHFGVVDQDIDENSFFMLSPYLNVYQYPLELDYHENGFKIPDNFIGLDAFVRKDPKKFTLPESFSSLQTESNKMIYVSMGSMGGYDIELMQKIVRILSKLPYKVIVSKGPRGDEYELPDNCWGENFLPQPEIVEMVDVVITHGGNNSFTEIFAAGKAMIVMPMFADQFDNAQRIQEAGYGIRMEPYDFTEQQLVDAVEKLMNNHEIIEKLEAVKQRVITSKRREEAAKRVEEVVSNFVQ